MPPTTAKAICTDWYPLDRNVEHLTTDAIRVELWQARTTTRMRLIYRLKSGAPLPTKPTTHGSPYAATTKLFTVLDSCMEPKTKASFLGQLRTKIKEVME